MLFLTTKFVLKIEIICRNWFLAIIRYVKFIVKMCVLTFIKNSFMT